MSKYGSYTILYPKLDEEELKWIEPSAEILVQHGSHYFFSPGFKTSDFIVENILRRYTGGDSPLNKLFKVVKNALVDERMVTRSAISKDKKNMERLQHILETINHNQPEQVKLRDVLAYYKDLDGTENFYLLTKEWLFSDYRDDNRNFIRVPLKNITIKEQGIYNLAGERLVKGGAFSARFIDLFKEIRALGEKVELTNYKHPLREESLETRIKYMGILAAECFYDGFLSANEVIRLEILARQLEISSALLIEKMREAVERRTEENSNYLSWALKKVNDIPERYYYVLFHDAITLELLTSSKVENEKESNFTNKLIDRCDLEKNFVDAYRDAIQNFVYSSYEIRTMMENHQNRIQEESMINNIFESIRFEYHMQEEMLRRQENGI